MSTNRILVGVVVLLLGATIAPAAWADTFSLAFCDTTLCANGVTGPFGTVTTTLNTKTGAINVSVMTNFGYGIYGGGSPAFGFNVVDPEAGLAITNVSSGFSVGAADANLPGFGIFEYTLNGPTNPLSALSFTVNRTGGFSSASLLDELSVGSAGIRNTFFSAHVKILSGVGAGQTGYAGAGIVTPEPVTLVLAVSGIAGATGAWVRRRRRDRVGAPTA
ncbi:MAG TPA: hypothetical protein VGT02_18045 [Methylomirabilota bacterium]|jgi:hypothetical protein|nr:hypothetical protein [Methylomirabilota bacterium]